MTTVMMDGVDTASATMRVPYGQTVHGEEEIAAVVEVHHHGEAVRVEVERVVQRVAGVDELKVADAGILVQLQAFDD